MKVKTIVIGLILIALGVGVFMYYDEYIRPDRAAKELILEGRIVYERGDRASINNAIDLFTKVIVKYPESSYADNAYYYIGRCYENLGLHRLAYLKYIYVLKNNRNLSANFRKEILIRLAHIKVLKQYSDEALNQLYGLLSTNYNKEFRSRVYSELGHTYLKLRDYRKAKQMFDIALSEYGSNEDAIIGKARALKWMGNDNEAYDLYEYFLKYYGAVSQYTSDVKNAFKEQAYNSALNAFRNGRYAAAISYFNRILRNFPYDKKSENALYWTGECYYAMGQFDKAISFFNRTLTNGYYHKDEDARIKKGYSYFSSKRFDLAAREFQIYLQQYPYGKYAPVARNWEEMSTKELLFRIETKKLPNTQKSSKIQKPVPDNGLEEIPLDEESEPDEFTGEDEEISGDYYEDVMNGEKVRFENVAEL